MDTSEEDHHDGESEDGDFIDEELLDGGLSMRDQINKDFEHKVA